MADQGSEGLLSPYLRKKRIAAALPYLKGNVLDVGCGIGTLCDFIHPDRYLGVDLDVDSIKLARSRYSMHKFKNNLLHIEEKFDTVVSLAVIEHVPSPVIFFQELLYFLSDQIDSRIVITTPHPIANWIHNFGTYFLLFSRHANEEHEDLLDKNRLISASSQAKLNCAIYKRFLFFINQIAVFNRKTNEN